MGKDSHQFGTMVATVYSKDFSAKQSFMQDC